MFIKSCVNCVTDVKSVKTSSCAENNIY